MGSLRHIILDGEPWFVAADVCRCLGFSVEKGTSRYLSRLLADEQRRETLGLIEGMRGPAAILINESGLYKLILRSDKATARPFQDWVTKVVLPAIRKTGGLRLRLPI